MGNGVTEVGHEAITHILGVVTLIFLDDSLRNLMEIIDRVSQVFQVEVISEYTGVYEIATHQGHLPSVRDRVGGTESTACQIIRVGLGIGKLRRRDGAATIAKLAGGRNLSPAFRATQRE